MSSLPKGWVSSRLEESIYLNQKFTNIDDESKCGFVPMTMVPIKYGAPIDFETKTWAQCKKGYTQFQDNDVLLAKITPCFENGKGALVSGLPNGVGAGSTEYFVLRSVGSLVEPKYLHAFVKTRDFLNNCETNMSGSVGHRRVPKDYLLNYPMPLAPLAEQKRIVEKLDEVLAQVDTIKARLDGIPSLLKRFRQSVLASAVSGKLTEEWREVNGISLADWETRSIESLCARVAVGFVGSIKPFLIEGDGVPLLSTTHVQQDGFAWKEQRFVTKEFSDGTRKSLVKPGDILVARHGDSGRCCLVPDDFPVYQTSNVVIIKTNDKSLPKYLVLAMNALKDIVKKEQVGGVMKVINTKSVAAHQIPCPNITEQEEIVRLVDQYFAFADTIEAQVKKAQARVNNLTQSILAKAFRGELVPQDPNDESADKLLERIAQARIEAEALAKAAKKAETARKKAEKAAAKG